MIEFEQINVNVDDGVAVVTLDRPERLNAIGSDTVALDAASLRAEALVERGPDGEPWLTIDFEKRTITLAPIATLIGLACGVVGIHFTTALVPPQTLGPYSIFLTFAPIGMWAIHAGVIKFTARHWAASPDRRALLRQIAGAGAGKLPWLLAACAVGTAASGGRADRERRTFVN